MIATVTIHRVSIITLILAEVISIVPDLCAEILLKSTSTTTLPPMFNLTGLRTSVEVDLVPIITWEETKVLTISTDLSAVRTSRWACLSDAVPSALNNTVGPTAVIPSVIAIIATFIAFNNIVPADEGTIGSRVPSTLVEAVITSIIWISIVVIALFIDLYSSIRSITLAPP